MKYERGFSLVELLVVIATMVLLSSVILATIGAARVKARLAKRVSDFREVKLALDMYYDANGSYPSTGGLTRSECALWGSFSANNVIPGLAPIYISAIPSEPTADKVGSISCYIYISNGIEYAFIDRLINEPGFVASSQPQLVDTTRVNTWKIYSPGASLW
ncbi:MAG TPA: prepilin-type N-terminal cleavage/methylation domain-containing protein [Candidatus Paceibacterota bacterium]|nr:prepilin-type N-terminal cleavage/methylation domain-containing protein [Candidatus Paceibacterota bacterium]